MTENINGSHDTTPDTAQAGADQNAGEHANAGAIRKSTTHSILNALSNASGQQFESVESALAWAARTGSQTNGGNEKPVEQQTQPKRMGRSRDVDNDLREQFVKLRDDLQVKEAALRQRDLDTEIMRYMGDKFDPDLVDYAMQKVKSNIQFAQDGSYRIVNQKGQERYANDGDPLTIQGLIQEVAQGNPKLLKQSNLSSGSGMRAGQGNFAGAPSDQMPDYSKDPAAFNQWTAKMGLGKGVGLRGTKVTATITDSSRKVL